MFARFLPCTASSPSASTALVAFDLTAPAQAFASPPTPGGEPLYEFSTCSLDGARGARRPPASRSARRRGLEALRRRRHRRRPRLRRRPRRRRRAEALAALRAAPPAAAPGCSRSAPAPSPSPTPACSTAAGRRPTGAGPAELAARFPAVEVDPDALYVDEGEVMTSAGLSAGIDLCLHVIRKDFGAAAGERVARHMVAAAAPRGRPGAVHRAPRRAERRRLAGADPALGGRAARASRSTSPRWPATPASARAPSPAASARRPGRRRCSGCSRQRVLEARRLLEESDLPVEDVAWRAGFGTAASLRDHFRRATATTPDRLPALLPPGCEIA